MYIPSFNRFDDKEQVVSFMKKYSFATIVTVKDNVPVATPLPFVVKVVGDQLILRSHFAKANPQADDIGNSRALVIFAEPHAYISPSNYEKEQNVPTWNYIAVHAYGNCNLLDGELNKAEVLEETIKYYEATYLSQYNNLNDEYKHKMMNGIVAFEMAIDDLQAKRKLSQNRSAVEKANIIQSLNQSPDSIDRDIADYMSEL